MMTYWAVSGLHVHAYIYASAPAHTQMCTFRHTEKHTHTYTHLSFSHSFEHNYFTRETFYLMTEMIRM